MSFTAKWRGGCAQCDEPVVPGQQVEYNFDNELQHVTCPDSLDQRTGKPRAICPRCFTELPYTGTCGVCEPE